MRLPAFSDGCALNLSIREIHVRRALCSAYAAAACDHRAVLTTADLPTIRRGNTTRLRDLKLRCGHCGGRGQAPEQFTLYMPGARGGGGVHAREGRERGGVRHRGLQKPRKRGDATKAVQVGLTAVEIVSP